MKILILVLATFLSGNVLAQNRQDGRPVEVIKVLSDKSVEDEFEVTEDSFVPNLNGYACAWPGIIGSDNIMNYHAQLRHGDNWDRNGLRVVFQENNEFCGWPTGEEVFGPEFKLGAKLDLTYRIKREIVKIKDHDDVVRKYLRETVSTKVLTREVKSSAYVKL